jgi:SAM-dependent methyltransferase
MSEPADVPSPIDLTTPSDAAEWERTAMPKRPWRLEFFDSFAAHIPADRRARVLELGSGPGFLAQHLLSRLPTISMVLLDFSAAMHALAKERLGYLVNRATFLERSFKEPDWSLGLGPFDVVVTHQAVHELRHKRHAGVLHRQVRSLLSPAGQYLLCDHHVGLDGMSNRELYMSIEEQRDSLLSAGFTEVLELKRKGGLVLHSAA